MHPPTAAGCTPQEKTRQLFGRPASNSGREALAADSSALALVQQVRAQAADKALKPTLKCSRVVMREAAAACARKRAKLDKAASGRVQAEKWFQEAKDKQRAAAVELCDAEQARLAAIAASQALGHEDAPEQRGACFDNRANGRCVYKR